ncbi:unnamed protein product [Trichogramma brassicae]|uniref:Uncharacterized protein n=1 Tax=Trichogramma brassicae TaxID=86971 RepID=A0A6H5I107_9HYME|nr:unnamed protein product [Trichogramma brassicae]
MLVSSNSGAVLGFESGFIVIFATAWTALTLVTVECYPTHLRDSWRTGRVVRNKKIYRAHDASHVKRKTSMRESRGGAAAARSCCWLRRQLVPTLLALLLVQLGMYRTLVQDNVLRGSIYLYRRPSKLGFRYMAWPSSEKKVIRPAAAAAAAAARQQRPKGVGEIQQRGRQNHHQYHPPEEHTAVCARVSDTTSRWLVYVQIHLYTSENTERARDARESNKNKTHTLPTAVRLYLPLGQRLERYTKLIRVRVFIFTRDRRIHIPNLCDIFYLLFFPITSARRQKDVPAQARSRNVAPKKISIANRFKLARLILFYKIRTLKREAYCSCSKSSITRDRTRKTCAAHNQGGRIAVTTSIHAHIRWKQSCARFVPFVALYTALVKIYITRVCVLCLFSFPRSIAQRLLQSRQGIDTGYKDEPDLDEDGKPSSRRVTPVHNAIDPCRHLWFCARLFKIFDRFDVNYANEDGLSHFHIACMAGCYEAVKKFLEHGQDPNLRTQKTGFSPLHCAMFMNRKQVAELLLKHGADPNALNQKKMTPLQVCCRRDAENYDAAIALLEHRVDDCQPVNVDVRNLMGETPLHWAVARNLFNNRSLIESLLRNGVDPNCANEDGFTPVHIVGMRDSDDHDLVKMLFELSNDKYKPVRVNSQDMWGRSPLHWALLRKNKKVAEYLLKNGADPNLASKDGSTALHIVCKSDRDDDDSAKMVFERIDEKYKPLLIDARDELVNKIKDNHALAQLFLEINDDIRQCVELDTADKMGNTPLHLSFRFKCKTDWRAQMAEILLRRGADPSPANAKGRTPLHLICISDPHNYDFLKLFFEIDQERHRKVQVNAQDASGWTPLHYALDNKLQDVGGILLREGADPNIANEDGQTPLHLMCYMNSHHGFVEAFFDICDEKNQLVQVDAKDKLGQTPLQLAVANLLPRVVDVLLNHGADLSSFVFPTESCFKKQLNNYAIPCPCEVTLGLACNAAAMLEVLHKRGFKRLYHSGTIQSIMMDWGYFDRVDLKKWYHDEKFAQQAKQILIRDDDPSLSLYDMIPLKTVKTAELLSTEDYLKLAQSKKLRTLPEKHIRACVFAFVL